MLKETFAQHGFPLTAYQVAQLDRYRAELLRWNEFMNLTAITDDSEIIHKHFLDSLSVLEHISLKDGDSVIDIGTGAGFPGVVLKIYVPGIQLTLVEASKKKVSFLKFLIPQLHLQSSQAFRRVPMRGVLPPACLNSVEVLAERAEVCAQMPAHIRRYDWAFTRYVAAIKESAAYCMPLLKSTGKWIAYKSGAARIKTEIDESVPYLRALGGAIETVFKNPKFNRSYVVMHRAKKEEYA